MNWLTLTILRYCNKIFGIQITAPSYDVDINSNGNWEQMFNIPAIEVTCAEFDKITIPAQQIHVAETYDLGSDWNCYIEYYKFNGNIQQAEFAIIL